MNSPERDPWTPDRELTAAQAKAAIAEAVPSLAGADVRLLGSGWDFDAYEADGAYVFKFARRKAEVTRLDREIALLALLDGRFALPIPQYQWPRLEASAFPYPFSGYRKVIGRPLLGLEPTPARIDALGRALGPFLSALHEVTSDDLVERLGEQTRPDLDLAGFRTRRRKYLERVHEWAPAGVADRVRAWWDDPAVVPPDHDGTPCLIHSDLHSEHVLMDEATGDIVAGVIDWGDAEIRDPSADFTGVAAWGGGAVLDAMLAHYTRDEPGIADRALFGAIQFCVVDTDYFHRTGKPEHIPRTVEVLQSLLDRSGY